MKIIFLLLNLVIFSYAIDINITSSKDTSVSDYEVELFKASMLNQHIRISSEVAKDVISENRYLCEEYLKNSSVPKKVILNFKLELEKHFSSEVIKEIQEKIVIDDDASYSYYISHLDEFIKPEKIKLSLYKIKDFESAMDLFAASKNSKESIQNYIKEHNISVSTQEVSLHQLDTRFRNLINFTKKQTPYFTPPQFFHDHYTVLEVLSKTPQGNYSYLKVKDKIHKILYKKAYKRHKDEILSQYRKSQKSL